MITELKSIWEIFTQMPDGETARWVVEEPPYRDDRVHLHRGGV